MRKVVIFGGLAFAVSACVVETTPSKKANASSGAGGDTNTSSGATTSADQSSSAATTSGSGAGGCTGHLDCGSDQVCLQGSCNVAYGREFAFAIVSAAIPEVDPSTGEHWDVPGGLPDPIAFGLVNNQVVYTTATIDNTLAPQWSNESFAIVINDGATKIGFRLEDYDDVSSNDFITGVEAPAAYYLKVARFSGFDTWTDPNNGAQLSIYVDIK